MNGTTAAEETAPRWASSALLVIDMQHDFLDGGESPVPGTEAVLPAIERLLTAYRRARLPIVHVVRLYRGEDVDLPRRALVRSGRGPVRPGTPGARVVSSLLPRGTMDLDDELLLAGGVQSLGQDEVVLFKPRWSAFHRTPLERRLRDGDVSTVVIAGCNFPNCPRATAYDASARDLRVVIVDDAVSGATPDRLADIRLIGAHVADSYAVDEALRCM